MGKQLYNYDNIDKIEFIEYYKTHSRKETAEQFNLSEQAVKRFSKKIGFRKSSDLVILQIEKTCLEKYGVSNYNKSEDRKIKSESITKKRKATNLERYGDENYNNQDQIKDTILKTYGVDNIFKTPECIAKSHTKEAQEKRERHHKETCIERYGVESYSKTDQFKNKLKSICQKNFGVDYYLLTPECQAAAHSEAAINKKISTCNDKYGVDWYTQSDMYHKHAKKNYIYNNITFDSLPELALYLYAINHNEVIVRSPCSFKYIYNDKVKYYHPDFLYNNQLIEIKGDHFFKEDGTMCNPFDHSQDELYEAKHQCGLSNGVKF